MQTEFSLQSGAHFADPIFQKCSKRSVSYSFETQIELSLLSCGTFCRPHLPKSAPRLTDFFNILKCKSSSRHSPAHFLSTTFPDRGRQPRKQRPYFGDPWMRITRQKHKVLCPGALSPVHAHAPDCESPLLLPRASGSC